MKAKAEPLQCKFCGSFNTHLNGSYYSKLEGIKQKVRCRDCSKESYYGKQDKFPLQNIIIHPFQSPPKLGISELELRAKHDISYKIRQTAESLNGDFYTEYDFIKLCNIPGNSGYRQVIESGAFDIFRGRAGNTVYWSSPASIQKMKNEGVLK